MVAGVAWARVALAVLAQLTARSVPRTMSSPATLPGYRFPRSRWWTDGGTCSTVLLARLNAHAFGT